MIKLSLIVVLFLTPSVFAATIACVTTPGTYNWSAGASWVGGVAPGNGDRATCATSGVIEVVDVNTTIGDSPSSGTNVVTFSGGSSLGFAQNVRLTIKGELSLTGAGSKIMAAGASILFESAGAASPTATPYTLHDNGIWTNDATHPPTAASKFTVTADTASGTNWRWATTTNGSGTSGMGNLVFQFCGDTAGAAPCAVYGPGGSGILTLGASGAPMIFDHTCGVKWTTSGITSNDGFNNNYVSFENTYAGCLTWSIETSNNVPTGGVLRTFSNSVFDRHPSMEGSGQVYDRDIFLTGYTDPQAFGRIAVISNSLINVSFQSASTPLVWNNSDNILNVTNFTPTNDLIIADVTTTFVSGVPTKQTPYTSGTATSAATGSTTSTLTDTHQSWTTHAYQTGNAVVGPNNSYMVVITGGTGAGESLQISDNTATALTLLSKWLVQPDATSTYAVYDGMFNLHWTHGVSLLPGDNRTYSGNIGQLVTGADNNGDFWHSVVSAPATNCWFYFGAYNNAITYAAFNAVIESGVYYSSNASGNIGHDPATDGGVHWTVIPSITTLADLVTNCGTYTFTGTVMLPNPTRDNSGTLSTSFGSYYFHNTYFTGAQSNALDEAQPSQSQFTKEQESLAWAVPGTVYIAGASGTIASKLGPYLMADTNAAGPGPSPSPDLCAFNGSGSYCDYNGGYGLLSNGWCASPTGANQGGSGAYNLPCTRPLGTHDVYADPQFIDRWTSPQKWIQSLGYDTSSVDPVEIMPNVWACMMKLNDPGFDTRCTVANLYTYLHHGIDFQNVAFHNAGADGLDIGAGSYIPNTTITQTRTGSTKQTGTTISR